jgi:RNA polymerase sigma-70 factor (ECF subfamily)
MTEGEFEAIFEEHKQAVYQFAWRMTNSVSSAEDITQDVFVAIFRGEAELDHSRGSMRALLLGIARHMAWKRWRRDQRWNSLEEEPLPTVPPLVDHLETEQAVSAAVAALPPLQREALILATYQGFSLQEIAEILGVEVGTVKARLHRARENLKRLLAPHRSRSMRSVTEYGTAK